MKESSLFRKVFLFLACLFIGEVAGLSAPYSPTFPYARELLPKYGNRALTIWAQFDGVHYLTIAEKGYIGTGLVQAFFPIYPLLIKLVDIIFHNYVISGLTISFTCFVLSLNYLRKLILIDHKPEVSEKSLLLLVIFPTSFFFFSLYTESLFLLLVVASFYAARKSRWYLAGIFGFLAGSTRMVGIFLFPALVYEYWAQNRKLSPKIISTVGPILGLLVYMYYLWSAFGDPLMFYHVQDQFGASRTSESLILLPQVFYRYTKMFLTTPISNPIFPILIQEFFAGILGILSLVVSWLKLRRSYVVFGIGAYLLPTLTGTLSSMPRYLLPIFPIYLLLAKYLPKKLYYIVVSVFIATLVYNVIRFTSGAWVA